MKKLLPLVVLSALIVGCESRLDKIKIRCVNIDFINGKDWHKERIEKQLEIIKLFGNERFVDFDDDHQVWSRASDLCYRLVKNGF